MRLRPSPTPLSLIALAALLVLLSACAGYGPGALAPGASRADALRVMGPPTGEYDLAALPGVGTSGAVRRVEFARGPFGRHTYMLDFDAGDHLLAATQVLTEARFNRLAAGQDQASVRAMLGRPSATSRITWQPQTVWSYRYESLFCQWFQVGIDPQGKVLDTGYAPDPACDVDNPESMH